MTFRRHNARQRSWGGELLIANGIVHTAMGIVLGWPSLREMLEKGLFNSVYELELSGLPYASYSEWLSGFAELGGARPRVFWFLWTGFPLIMLGAWARRLEIELGRPVPEWLAWSLALYAGVGAILVTVTGFWIGLACSVYLVVVARRARTTAPSRLPDQGLHRFRPAEALPKERGSS